MMPDFQPADILDTTSTRLLEGLSCLSNAAELLLDGLAPFNPEIRRWLSAANDDLEEAGLEDGPGDIRRELATAIELIDRQDPQTASLVNPMNVDLLHRRVAILFRSHFRFSRLSPSRATSH
jgi:hypothetical protein